MKVVIRESAYADLDRIYAWIANDNPRAAVSVIDRILDSTELLGRNPHIGHTIDTSADLLMVVAVFHGAQDR